MTAAFPAPPRSDEALAMSVPPHVARPDPVPRVGSPRVAALAADVAAAEDPVRIVEEFWTEVEASGAPLLEEVADGQCTYTFLHRGRPGTERVALLGNKTTDAQTLHHALFEHVAGTDVWWQSLRLGSGWRASYAIAAQHGRRPALPARIAELLEQRRTRSLAVTEPADHPLIEQWYDLQYYAAPDPLSRIPGRPANPLPSVAEGPDAPVALPLTAGAPGRVVPVEPAVPGRQLWWHIPAGPAPETWDVLVLLDGELWAAAPEALDAWQASGVLPPTATLLVGSGPLPERVRALTCSPELVGDLVGVLDSASIPGAVAEQLGAPLSGDPARTRIAGQSLGGLTALYAQCAAPQRFGVSICQSGSFWWPNPGEHGQAEWLTRAIADSGTRLGTVMLEVGLQEWVLLEPTRRLRDVLDGACQVLGYGEYEGGHDEACWTVSLPRMLQASVPAADSAAREKEIRAGEGEKAGNYPSPGRSPSLVTAEATAPAQERD